MICSLLPEHDQHMNHLFVSPLFVSFFHVPRFYVFRFFHKLVFFFFLFPKQTKVINNIIRNNLERIKRQFNFLQALPSNKIIIFYDKKLWIILPIFCNDSSEKKMKFIQLMKLPPEKISGLQSRLLKKKNY